MCSLSISLALSQVNEVFADFNQNESFGSDDVTLTLMLRRPAGVFYSITSVPNAQIMYSNMNASARLRLSYNTEYNISMIASVLCGYRNESKILTLKYGEYIVCSFCLHECTKVNNSELWKPH